MLLFSFTLRTTYITDASDLAMINPIYLENIFALSNLNCNVRAVAAACRPILLAAQAFFIPIMLSVGALGGRPH